MEYIERCFPQTLDTMPNGSATVPVTAAGNLAVGIAETLTGVILAYTIDENAIVCVDIIPSYCDMQSGIFRYASAERMPLLVARVQMISEYYGCPSGVHGGKTDSCFVNVQCGMENKSREVARSIWQEHPEPIHRKIKAINEVVTRAEKHFLG